jgi:regulator of nucleoside diphosphate kinase
MAERDIFITEEDHEKLMQLIQGARQHRRKDLAHVEQLDGELERAHLVPSREIPPDVVTMNSRVVLRDLDTDEEIELTLVFPRDANVDEHRVSVLAPLGTAILGYRSGNVIEWQMPGRTRHLEVERVVYQPEAAAVNKGA